MKGELLISELSIGMDAGTGRKYLYGSLIDFYAESEEELDRLTGTMIDNGLFRFNNVGRHEGVDSRSHMHWTLDDGKPSMDWLLKVAGVVRNMNEKGDRLVIKLNKGFLLHHKAIEDMTKERVWKAEDMERLIELYAYYLRKVMGDGGYGDLLKTKVQGRLSHIPSMLEDGKIYIEA